MSPPTNQTSAPVAFTDIQLAFSKAVEAVQARSAPLNRDEEALLDKYIGQMHTAISQLTGSRW